MAGGKEYTIAVSESDLSENERTFIDAINKSEQCSWLEDKDGNVYEYHESEVAKQQKETEKK